MPVVIVPQPSFLGTGAAFPLQLDSSGTRPLILSEEDLVIADMKSLILTQIGERPFLVRNGIPYGTNIRRALFESEDVAGDIITYETNRAISTWELRVALTGTVVSKIANKQGGVTIAAETTFIFRATNTPGNFVLPYALSRVA